MTPTLSASTWRELCRIWDWRGSPTRLRLYVELMDHRTWPPDADVERIRAEALKALGDGQQLGCGTAEERG